MRAVELPLDRIRPGRNVRRKLNNIESLARSIELVGLLQPIVVVQSEDGEAVEVVFGHRRLAACTLIQYEPVPCFVRPRGTESDRLVAQVAENVERDPMTPFEKAVTFRDLRRGGMSQAAIADAVGVNSGTVSKILMLLEYPEALQEAVHEGQIGLADCLAVPLEVAEDARPGALTLACTRGGRYLRDWARKQTAARARAGQPTARGLDFKTVAIEGGLGADVETAAREIHETIGEWVGKACRARLAEQDERRRAVV